MKDQRLNVLILRNFSAVGSRSLSYLSFLLQDFRTSPYGSGFTIGDSTSLKKNDQEVVIASEWCSDVNRSNFVKEFRLSVEWNSQVSYPPVTWSYLIRT